MDPGHLVELLRVHQRGHGQDLGGVSQESMWVWQQVWDWCRAENTLATHSSRIFSPAYHRTLETEVSVSVWYPKHHCFVSQTFGIPNIIVWYPEHLSRERW